jgi:hypothetical protein
MQPEPEARSRDRLDRDSSLSEVSSDLMEPARSPVVPLGACMSCAAPPRVAVSATSTLGSGRKRWSAATLIGSSSRDWKVAETIVLGWMTAMVKALVHPLRAAARSRCLGQARCCPDSGPLEVIFIPESLPVFNLYNSNWVAGLVFDGCADAMLGNQRTSSAIAGQPTRWRRRRPLVGAPAAATVESHGLPGRLRRHKRRSHLSSLAGRSWEDVRGGPPPDPAKRGCRH